MAAERFVELGSTRCLEVVVRGGASQPKLHGDVVANPTAASKPPVIAGLGRHGNPFPNRIELRVQRRAARRRTLDRSQEFFDPAHGAERDRGVIPVRRVQGRFGRCENGDDGLAGLDASGIHCSSMAYGAECRPEATIGRMAVSAR